MADDDDLIPDTGAVFTFGRSRFADNIANKFWIKNDPVLYVACGDEHSAVLTERGRVYAFGSNDWGQLGLGHHKPLNKPSFIKALKPEKIILLGCGRSHTLTYSESRKLFSFGANGDGQLGHGDKQDGHIPKEIATLSGIALKSISCGAYHSAAVTEDGEVYVWGVNSDGQLGLGEVEECSVPTKLNLEGYVTSLSCGYYHTALITQSGLLLTFGENENGKLGLSDSQCDDTTFPQSVGKLELDKYVAVSCGACHTVAITEKGHCYSWGDGSHGQLGHGTMQLEVALPKQISLLNHLKIVYVSCGDGHTAIITDSGKIYTFGDGRHGKLGQGDECFSNLFKPTAISRFNGFHVNFVACGGCHMLVGAIRKNKENADTADGEMVTEEEDTLNASMHSNTSIAEANMTLKPGCITYPLVTQARVKRRHKKDVHNDPLNMNSSLNSSLNMAQLSRTMVQLPTVLDRSRLPRIPGVNQISINNYERKVHEQIIEDQGEKEVEAEKKEDRGEVMDKDCEYAEKHQEGIGRKDKEVEISYTKNKDVKEATKQKGKGNQVQENNVKKTPLKNSKKIEESDDEDDEEISYTKNKYAKEGTKQKGKGNQVQENNLKKSPLKNSKKIEESDDEDDEDEYDEDGSEDDSGEEEINVTNKQKGKVTYVQGNKIKSAPQNKSKQLASPENEADDTEEEIDDEEHGEDDTPDEEEDSQETKKKKKHIVDKQEGGKEDSKGKRKNKEVNKRSKVKGSNEAEVSPKKSSQKKTSEKKYPGKKGKTVKENEEEEMEDDDEEDDNEDDEDDEDYDYDDEDEEEDDEEDDEEDGAGDKTDGKTTKKNVKSNGDNKKTNIEEAKTEANNRSGFLNFFRRNKKPQVDVAPSSCKSPEKTQSDEGTDKNQSKMCMIL